MVDAPDKLWLSTGSEDNEHEVWFDPDEGGTEYVRADTHATAIAALVAERNTSAVQWRKYGDEMHQRAMAAEAQVKAIDEALGPVESKSERYADKERNKIINLASDELENVINGHDPDMSILGNDVWDHLDRLCCAIEAHVARRARAVKGGEND